ncbi:DUF4232 domain-containing protein [Streptomyces sp. CA-250714]|uniref:DUF4232 domain-containing protein n=1 Tax=Streptomyces sp. CA-250714 TaxID=3240060 RepID=UPI003D91B0EE
MDRSTRLAAVVAVGLAAVLLTGCGKEGAGTSAPKKVAGEAAPVPGDSSKDKSGKKSASPSSPSKSRNGDKEDREGPPDSSGNDGTSSSGSATGGSGPGTPTSASCRTSDLALSTANGMGEGSLLVNFRNTGSAACTLKGFPGVDLQTEGGGSLNAARNNAAAPAVSIEPGEATHFTLNYPPNDSGGSGVDVTGLVVTPPNETTSKTVPASINLPVSDSPDSSITVSPVGAG